MRVARNQQDTCVNVAMARFDTTMERAEPSCVKLDNARLLGQAMHKHDKTPMTGYPRVHPESRSQR